MPKVTVLLRTLNAGGDLAPLLDILSRQTVVPVEILVVDSGSTDGTVDRAREGGARVVCLDRGQFTHARSTNVGFREARGDLVAMLSQDALPENPTWLENLLAALDSPSVAAVFGRQLPRENCFALERWELDRCYPAGGPPAVVYSNVNSLARRARWEEIPFDESVDIAEDRLWALAQAARGHEIAYAPRGAVLHSHTYSLQEVYARCRAEARVRFSAEGVGESWQLLWKAWPRQALLDARRLRAEGKLRAWPRAAAYRFSQFAGMAAGGRG